MGARELGGGAATSVKADQVPAYVVAFATSGFLPVRVFNQMTMMNGNQSAPLRPVAAVTEPVFGTHIREALRILGPKREA